MFKFKNERRRTVTWNETISVQFSYYHRVVLMQCVDFLSSVAIRHILRLQNLELRFGGWNLFVITPTASTVTCCLSNGCACNNDTPAVRAIDAHDDMISVIKNFTVANIRLEICTIYHSAWCMSLSSLKAHFATEVCFERQIEDTSCRISGYFHTTTITVTQGQLLGWTNLSNCWQMRPQYSCFTPRCGNHKPVENWPLLLDTFLSTFWRAPTNM